MKPDRPVASNIDRVEPSRPWVVWSRAISTSVAVLLATVALYYSVRGIDWGRVARLARDAEIIDLVAVAGIGSTALFLRSFRWRVLLNSEGSVSMSTAFWATACGYFGNNFLPARAGELVRTFMISSRSNLEGTFVLATALSERMADAIALVGISTFVLLSLPEPPAWLARAVKSFAVVGVIALLMLALLPRLEWLGARALQQLPFPKIRRLSSAVLEQALRGIRTFHDIPRLVVFLALTAIIWCMDAVGVILVGTALSVPITLPVAFLLISGLGLGSAIPSTPGYVGIYQFVAVTVLTPFGISRTDAIAYILVAQALTYVVISFWGALGMWRYRRMGLTDRSAIKTASPS